MARPRISGKPLENKGICKPRVPCPRTDVGKKIGDMVIANPPKTLENQANPAKRPRTGVGKKNRLHGYRTSANRWKPLGNMVSLMVPMFCGASADLTGSRGCLPWNVIKSAESPKTLSCSQSLAMLYALEIIGIPCFRANVDPVGSHGDPVGSQGCPVGFHVGPRGPCNLCGPDPHT